MYKARQTAAISVQCQTQNEASSLPYKHFAVGLPVVSGGRARQAWLPNYIQGPASGRLVVRRRLGTEEANCHYPASGTRLEDNPVPLESAEWWVQVGCWRPKPVKWKISGHSSGREDKRASLEVAYLRWPTGGPLLCNPVDEGQLAAIGWLSFNGPSASCWCYVCRIQGQTWRPLHNMIHLL